MSRTIQRRPQVAFDLIEQADYIARDNLDAALRYLDAAEATFRDLAQQPTLGSRCILDSPRAAGLLRWRVGGFENYLIFYRPIDNGIEIVRVIHGAWDIEAVLEDEESGEQDEP
jgi:toxin ParE1/3/4